MPQNVEYPTLPLNVGKPTLPLNENVVCHRRSCYRATLTQSTSCRNRCGIVHLTSKQVSHFVKTDFDNLPKEGSKQLT